MNDHDILAAFPFDRPAPPVSLYAYAPVWRVTDRHGDWVVKRTGTAHSDGVAIAAWLDGLRDAGVDVVAPVASFTPNPRWLRDGCEWVVYPFVSGVPYEGTVEQLHTAGALLGRIHAFAGAGVAALRRYDTPFVRDAAWAAPHLAAACAELRRHGDDADVFVERVAARLATARPVAGLPLAGCSVDFKASNLVFAPHPTLVDPDHAAFLPRLYDLAIAIFLFHNDLPNAPARMWTPDEWRVFRSGYQRHVVFTKGERFHWPAILRLAWLDQALWLLGNFPEGWADPRERAYLRDLAAADLDRFTLD